jgi:hypothetical protein
MILKSNSLGQMMTMMMRVKMVEMMRTMKRK